MAIFWGFLLAGHNSYPVLEFRVIATNRNEKQLPTLLKMAEDLGVNSFSVKSLRPYDYRGTAIDSQMVPSNPLLRRYNYNEGDSTSRESRVRFAHKGPLRCGKPMYDPNLNSDGNLVFCCYAQEGEELYGNLSEGGFKRVWRSKKAREQRLRFLENGGTDLCTNCYFRTDHKSTILSQVPFRSLPTDISLQNPSSKQEFLDALIADEPERVAGQ